MPAARFITTTAEQPRPRHVLTSTLACHEKLKAHAQTYLAMALVADGEVDRDTRPRVSQGKVLVEQHVQYVEAIGVRHAEQYCCPPTLPLNPWPHLRSPGGIVWNPYCTTGIATQYNISCWRVWTPHGHLGSWSPPAPFGPAERNPTLRLGRTNSGELENQSEGHTKNSGWPLLRSVAVEDSVIHLASTAAMTTSETAHNHLLSGCWRWESADLSGPTSSRFQLK